MLFPCGFGVFPKSQPRPQDFGRSYNPYGSFGAEVPKTLVRSALPSAVILDGVHLQPRPFHLLLFRPCRKSVTLRKPPDLSLCETRPKRGLRGGLWVFSRPRWETRHTGRHGGSQGRHPRPATSALPELRPHPRRGLHPRFLRVGRFPCLRGLLRIFLFCRMSCGRSHGWHGTQPSTHP